MQRIAPQRASRVGAARGRCRLCSGRYAGAGMSLTGGEKVALRWVVAVVVLGAGAQLVRQWRHADAATPAAAQALSRQLLAVDSAQRAGRRGRAGRTAVGQRERRGAGAVADTFARRRRSSRRRGFGGDASEPGGQAQLPTLERVDLDRADAATIERLPRIGPALAGRIVSDRVEHGPFGSLGGLQRVRGIGPRLARALDSLVTFSGTQRPSPVQR